MAASVLKSVFPVVGNDFVANVNALITYVNLASRYQFLDLVLRLSTERTTQRSVSLFGKELTYCWRWDRRFWSLGFDTTAKFSSLWQSHYYNPAYCVLDSFSSVQMCPLS